MEQPKRRPGRPARIDRERILCAALALEAAQRPLTMQAVADELGVHRGALYHHIADREQLVATARLTVVPDNDWMLEDDADWRVWLAAFARNSRAGLLAGTAFPEYYLWDGEAGHRQAVQVERVLAVLCRDGFTLEAASRCMTLIGEVVHSNARAAFMHRAHGAEPHRATAQRVIDADPDSFPLIRALSPADPDVQFTYDLDVLLSGVAL